MYYTYSNGVEEKKGIPEGKRDRATRNRIKIKWDEEYNICRAQIFGTLDKTTGQTILSETERLAKKYGTNIRGFIDIGFMSMADFSAMKYLVHIASHGHIQNLVIVGHIISGRTLAELTLALLDQKNVRYFEEEKEALEWLEEINE